MALRRMFAHNQKINFWRTWGVLKSMKWPCQEYGLNRICSALYIYIFWSSKPLSVFRNWAACHLNRVGELGETIFHPHLSLSLSLSLLYIYICNGWVMMMDKYFRSSEKRMRKLKITPLWAPVLVPTFLAYFMIITLSHCLLTVSLSSLSSFLPSW